MGKTSEHAASGTLTLMVGGAEPFVWTKSEVHQKRIKGRLQRFMSLGTLVRAQTAIRRDCIVRSWMRPVRCFYRDLLLQFSRKPSRKLLVDIQSRRASEKQFPGWPSRRPGAIAIERSQLGSDT